MLKLEEWQLLFFLNKHDRVIGATIFTLCYALASGERKVLNLT